MIVRARDTGGSRWLHRMIEGDVVATQSGGWRAVIIAATLAVVSMVAMAALEVQPRPAADVAAIFPPWMARDAAFARVAAAGGLVVRQGALDTILVVHGGDPALVHRLYAAGAWAVIDPVAFGGCLAGQEERPN